MFAAGDRGVAGFSSRRDAVFTSGAVWKLTVVKVIRDLHVLLVGGAVGGAP